MGGYDRLAVARIFFFPALGGLLFGYDIGATSYVLTQLQSAKFSGVSWYDLVARSSALQGLVTSGGVGGAFVGASVVFKVADDLGRRRELLLGAALDVLGAACEFLGGGVGPYESGAGDGLFLLVLGRFVYGVGCGFVMHGAPSYTVSYIAEMSPAAIRGTLVSLKEAAIVVGICLGYGLGFALRETPGGWRYTYAASIPFALLLYWGAFCLPPSARWLSLKGDAAGARLDDGGGGGGGDDDARGEPRSLLDAKYRRALTAGLGVVLLQQLTGQPSVLYYASTIFDAAGIGTVATVFVGVFKLFATLFAVVTVDRRGRRELLFVGVGSMFVALAALALAFYDFDPSGGFSAQKGAIVGLIFVYIAGYQVGFGPIAWLLISEVFPSRRGSPLGSTWYLTVLFGIFAVLDLYALHFINRNVPETKGMTLEEIGGSRGLEAQFARRGPVPSDYLFPLEALDRPVLFWDQLGCGRSDRPEAGDQRYGCVGAVHDLRNVLKANDVDDYHLYGQPRRRGSRGLRRAEAFLDTHNYRGGAAGREHIDAAYARAGDAWRGTAAIRGLEAKTFSAVRCPTYVLRGEHDFVTEPCVDPWRNIADVRVDELPGRSHHALLEDGDDYVARLAAFLDALE
ncbi:hypothetical protein JL721_4590 [Aureococcus anophagefferens]|nr:hypothetical protein JL721_4590 [Aureococcus anophagefferens]